MPDCVLSSDPVRKQLLGIAPTTRAPESAYSLDMNHRTYLELGRRAAAAGGPVVIDATFRYAADREAFAAGAAASAESAVWIECRAPAAVIARHPAARASQLDRVSDADAAIATRQLAEWEPWRKSPRTIASWSRPTARRRHPSSPPA